MQRKRLIFVPTYNEKDNAERMARALAALPIDADLLFVDDNSPDGTGQALEKLRTELPQLTVMHRSGKLGVGSAHLDAISFAYERNYTELITLDCDFTHSPSDVLRIIETLEGNAVATASRYMSPDSLPGWNIVRRSLTTFGHILTTKLLKVPYDATGGLRGYNLTRISPEVFSMVKARGYGFFFESMFLLTRRGYAVAEFPIVLPARTYGHSKMSLQETLRSGSQLLSLWARSFLSPSEFRPTLEKATDAE
jgi:dolichol-phosphate mannosyltransferase